MAHVFGLHKAEKFMGEQFTAEQIRQKEICGTLEKAGGGSGYGFGAARPNYRSMPHEETNVSRSA